MSQPNPTLTPPSPRTFKILTQPDPTPLHPSHFASLRSLRSFKEDKAIDAVNDTIFPGSVLLKLGVYDDAANVPRWTNESDSTAAESTPTVVVGTKLIPVVVRVDIFCGRHLPVADADTGSLDPYIRATVNGVSLQTSVKQDTRNPTFFESLVFETQFPQDERLRPPIMLQIWDKDKGLIEKDDFVGNVALIHRLFPSKKSGEDGNFGRSWMPVFFQEPGDVQGGSVYVGVRVTKKEGTGSGSSSLSETGSDISTGRVERMPQSGATKTVQVVFLGCRGLIPLSSVFGLRKPCVKIKIGESQEQETASSNRPSSSNCNIGETLTFTDCVIPADPLFAPFINVKVVDCLGLGATSLVGTGALHLSSNDYYRRSQEDAQAADASDSARNPVVDKSLLPWVQTNAEYMRDRNVLAGELKVTPLFSSCSIFRGKRSTTGSPDIKTYDLVDVGKCRMFAAISDEGSSSDVLSSDILKQIQSPRRFRVRVYVLEATFLSSRATTIDPFVTVTLGKNVKKGETLKKKASHVELYQHFELMCKIPGDSTLTVDLTDWNPLGINELLGSTSIDVEERWFSEDWQRMTTKPIEHRDLFLRSKKVGKLACWVDIEPMINNEQKAPFYDITPPPSQEFELRAVVWKCEKVPFGDVFSETSDMYVRVRLGDGEWQQSDVHFLARKGKGSFNFRFIFALRLRSGGRVDGVLHLEGAARLTIQVWDADIMVSECLADVDIDLTDAFRTAFILSSQESGFTHQVFGKGKPKLLPTSETTALLSKTKEVGAQKKMKKKKKKTLWEEMRVALGLSAPEDSKWITLRNIRERIDDESESSRVLVTIEVLPASVAKKRPCGPGREDPNKFPILPPPEDRVDFSKMVNPFYAVQTLCGDALARECGWKCYLTLVVVVFLALGVVLGPEINILVSMLSILPQKVVGYIFMGIAVSILLCCFWCCCCACKKDKMRYDETQEDEDDMA